MHKQQKSIRIQIIDRCLGNLHRVFGFNGTDCAAIFYPAAEDFLREYSGRLVAHKK